MGDISGSALKVLVRPCRGYQGTGNPSSSSGKGSRQSTHQIRVGLGRNDGDLLWQPAPALGWVCLLLVQTLHSTRLGRASQLLPGAAAAREACSAYGAVWLRHI